MVFQNLSSIFILLSPGPHFLQVGTYRSQLGGLRAACIVGPVETRSAQTARIHGKRQISDVSSFFSWMWLIVGPWFRTSHIAFKTIKYTCPTEVVTQQLHIGNGQTWMIWSFRNPQVRPMIWQVLLMMPPLLVVRDPGRGRRRRRWRAGWRTCHEGDGGTHACLEPTA